MAGCWADAMVAIRASLRAGWVAARMAVQKAGRMAVSLADSMVGQMGG